MTTPALETRPTTPAPAGAPPGPLKMPELPALQLVEPSRAARKLAISLFLLIVSAPAVLIFVPWRQSVYGDGRVSGYAQLDRQQAIDSPITGRVQQWYVQEGSRVKKGDKVARVTDNDAEFLTRLADQQRAVSYKLDAARQKEALYIENVKAYQDYGNLLVSAAEREIEVAEQKVQAQQQEIVAAEIAYKTDRYNRDRIYRLFSDKLGLASQRDYEVAEQKFQESQAKFQKATADLEGVKAALEAKRADAKGKRADANTKIGAAEGSLRDARVSIGEYDKELRDIEAKLARQSLQVVTAPRDGTILRLVVNQGTEQVYEGEPIALIVPETPELAVELYVDGNDAPLISEGRHVRLQFEGWPAVQFAGWPSVAVGTFGGVVALVDSSDFNGMGKFRILVVPDKEDQPWPDGRFLRQGVRSKGWVLLNEVRLGYEFWRRINGFPPVLDKDPTGKADSKDKKDEKKPKVKRPKE
jgi:multidrug efflux pump subunit AcrA (membrane-fusion protein)